MNTLAFSVALLWFAAGCTLQIASDQRLDDLTARQARDEQRLDIGDRNFTLLQRMLETHAQRLDVLEKREK